MSARIASLQKKSEKPGSLLKSLKPLEKELARAKKEQEDLQVQLSSIQASLTGFDAEQMALNQIKEATKTSVHS